MALETIIGELIRIENGIEDVGDFIKKKFLKGKKRRRKEEIKKAAEQLLSFATRDR